MSKDAKEWCIVFLVGWIIASGLWSCGSQMWSGVRIILNHVVIVK